MKIIITPLTHPMNKISWYIAAFSTVFAAIHLLPIWMGKPFPLFPPITTGSVFDLLSPLVMVPLYWLLFSAGPSPKPGQRMGWEGMAFLVLAVVWVEGHSIHLPANAISLALRGTAGSSNAHLITHFYDEALSHYLWHFGMVGLSALIMHRQRRRPLAGNQPLPLVEVASGGVYGLIFFGAVIEGGTWPLGLPFAALVALFGLVGGWKRFRQQPVLTFFFVGYLVATVLFVGWAIYWGGFPQFSDVGIIQ